MKKLIGIRSLNNLTVENLKQDYLIFDKLFIIGLNEWKFEVKNENPFEKVRTFDNLILFDYYYYIYLNSKKHNSPENIKKLDKELDYLLENDKIIIKRATMFDIDNKYISKCQKLSREFSNYLLNYTNNRDYCKDIRKIYGSPISIEEMKAILKEGSIKNDDFPKRKELIGFYKDFEIINLAHEIAVREESIWFNHHIEYDSVPIVNNILPIENIETKKHSVLKIIINKLPMPSEDCQWEDIFNFKNDSDSYLYFLGLKNFVNDISNSNLNIHEIEEKIEYLLIQYENSLIKHKILTKILKQEKLIYRSIGFIENLLKGNFSELFKWNFQLKKEEIELHDLEIKSEGSELAYISKANSVFNDIDN